MRIHKIYYKQIRQCCTNMEEKDQNEPLGKFAPSSPLVSQHAILLSKRRGEMLTIPSIVNTKKHIETRQSRTSIYN